MLWIFTLILLGDSHTATHGAFGALAFGIGTSEVEHVLATQTLITKRSKNMRVKVDGQLAPGVSSKDIILHIIGKIGTAGGNGAVIEYCGSAIEGVSMEARMSIVSSPDTTISMALACFINKLLSSDTFAHLNTIRGTL